MKTDRLGETNTKLILCPRADLMTNMDQCQQPKKGNLISIRTVTMTGLTRMLTRCQVLTKIKQLTIQAINHSPTTITKGVLNS